MTHTYPTPEEVWRDFTGEESPRDFVVRLSGETVEACVDAHLDSLPSVFGIMRNADWNSTFRQPWQLRRDQVRHGLLAYLEAHREVWGLSEMEVPVLPEESDVARAAADVETMESGVLEVETQEASEEVAGDMPVEEISSERIPTDEPPARSEETTQSGE